MKELQLEAGDWWLYCVGGGILLVCKQVLFSFTSDKHTQTCTSLKIVWLWMQMRKMLFHSRHTQSTCVFSTGLETAGYCFTVSVLHVSKMSKYLECWWEAAEKRGQCSILSLATPENRERRSVPDSLCGPVTLLAEQCRGSTTVTNYANIHSPGSLRAGCVH